MYHAPPQSYEHRDGQQQQYANSQRRWSADAYGPGARAGGSAYGPSGPSGAGPYGAGGGGYNDRRFSHPVLPSEDDYEERDLGEYASANQAAQEQAWGQGPEAGVPMWDDGRSHYSGPQTEWGPPVRSVRSTPPPCHSLEVGSVYHPDQRRSPVSAPSAYGYYAEPLMQSPVGYSHEHYFPSPSPGTPASSSGRTLRSSAPSHPPSLYPGLSSPVSETPPPDMFGVTAPHHGNTWRRGAGAPSPRGDARDAQRGDYLPNFAAWSRTWYGGHLSANGHAYTAVAPASAETGWESETLTHSRPSLHGAGQSPYGYVANGNEGLSDYVKEERMRMLEKEFGPKVSRKGKGKGEGEEDGEEEEEQEPEELVMGSVDSRGKLVTPGPKKRVAARWLQGLVALVAAACGIGGVFLVKPEKAAPPAGSLPTYVLYVVSVVSFLVTLYLFALRPCCCDPTRRHDDGGAAGAGGPLSGLVVPVLSGGGGGPGGKKPGMFGGKRGKRGMRGMQQQGTTVNLIVDPTLLGGGGGQREDDSEDSDAEEHLPGGARRRKRRRGRAAGQLGVLGNMKLQARWRVARKSLKVNTVWDCILAVLWIAADVLALAIGKKCPPGSSGGWCDLYNGAIACGVIIVVVFCASIYFDFRDLRISRRAPKPPM